MEAINLTWTLKQALLKPEPLLAPSGLFDSIFGQPESRGPGPATLPSEFRFLKRNLPTLREVLVPRALTDAVLSSLRRCMPGASVAPFPRSSLFLGPDTGTATPAEECWFFINGICTGHDLLLLNLEALQVQFGRRFWALHNATLGLLPDLVECAAGKGWDSVTESLAPAVWPVVVALSDPQVKRVVLVAHSQGTILSAVLLKLLEEHLHGDTTHPLKKQLSPERVQACKLLESWDLVVNRFRAPKAGIFDAAALERFGKPQRQLPALTPAQVGKLELYAVANCATSMEAFVTGYGPDDVAPYIESFGNGNDLVARLGILAPTHGLGSTRIGGERFICPPAWGHLLNAHYLLPLTQSPEGWQAMRGNCRPRPRLLDYLNGGTPK